MKRINARLFIYLRGPASHTTRRLRKDVLADPHISMIHLISEPREKAEKIV